MNNNCVEPNVGMSKTKEMCVGLNSLGKGKTDGISFEPDDNEQVQTNANSVKPEGVKCKANCVEQDREEAQTNGNCVEPHHNAEINDKVIILSR